MLKLLLILGAQRPKVSCIGLAFLNCIDLTSNVLALLRRLLHCYMAIETFLVVDYTTLVLNKMIIFASLKKIWAQLQPGHTKNVGVVALRGPFVKIAKNHNCALCLL